jgi:hypothetical protein
LCCANHNGDFLKGAIGSPDTLWALACPSWGALVSGIGVFFGGTTYFPINPARDCGRPNRASILPIAGKCAPIGDVRVCQSPARSSARHWLALSLRWSSEPDLIRFSISTMSGVLLTKTKCFALFLGEAVIRGTPMMQ